MKIDLANSGTICIKRQKDKIMQKDAEIERLERELQETKTIVGNQAERLSDLEASPISEEVIDILRSKIKALEYEITEQCRINGMGAEREAALLGKVERQSAALKLAREALIGALSDDQPYINASKEAIAAINEVLGENNAT